LALTVFLSSVGGHIVVRKQLPRSVLEDYLNVITSQPEILDSYFLSKKAHTFPYGIDELFWNVNVVPWLREKKVPFSIHSKWSYERLFGGLTYKHNEYSKDRLSTMSKISIASLDNLVRRLGFPENVSTDRAIESLKKAVSPNSWATIDETLREWRKKRRYGIFLWNQLDFAILNAQCKSRAVVMTFVGKSKPSVQAVPWV